MRRHALVIAAAAGLLLAGRAEAGPEGKVAVKGPTCTGDYAEFLSSLRPENLAFEASPDASYSYCIRNVATYEHIFYGKGGKIRKQYIRHTSHGTGFAYRTKDGEYFVATNHHVAEHPDVTEDEKSVDGVPPGSRKVREVLKIVKNEGDDYEPGMVTLTKVASDEALDMAVTKTRHPLKIMPYRIGRSGLLKPGNAVQVRGYPLGVFAAANTGKVIAVNQPDRERGWNHDDFAVDALLNSGSSGSPVFAVSCRTGELELVGVYHAGYREAQGLNVVVGVDQFRDFLETLKPGHRDLALAAGEVALADRQATAASLRRGAVPVVIPFGERSVRVESAEGTTRFSLYESDYPLSTRVHMQLVDHDDDFMSPSGLVFPPRFGDNEIPWAALDPSVKEPAQKAWDALWKQLVSVLQFRELDVRVRAGTGDQGALSQSSARIKGRKGEQRDLLQSLDFESDAVAWPVVGAPPDAGAAAGAAAAATSIVPPKPDLIQQAPRMEPLKPAAGAPGDGP
jgi:serine protease Do